MRVGIFFFLCWCCVVSVTGEICSELVLSNSSAVILRTEKRLDPRVINLRLSFYNHYGGNFEINALHAGPKGGIGLRDQGVSGPLARGNVSLDFGYFGEAFYNGRDYQLVDFLYLGVGNFHVKACYNTSRELVTKLGVIPIDAMGVFSLTDDEPNMTPILAQPEKTTAPFIGLSIHTRSNFAGLVLVFYTNTGQTNAVQLYNYQNQIARVSVLGLSQGVYAGSTSSKDWGFALNMGTFIWSSLDQAWVVSTKGEPYNYHPNMHYETFDGICRGLQTVSDTPVVIWATPVNRRNFPKF